MSIRSSASAGTGSASSSASPPTGVQCTTIAERARGKRSRPARRAPTGCERVARARAPPPRDVRAGAPGPRPRASSDAAAARAEPPAPTISAGRPAGSIPASRSASSMPRPSVRCPSIRPVAEAQRVGGARRDRLRREAVAEERRGLLVRDRDVGADDPERAPVPARRPRAAPPGRGRRRTRSRARARAARRSASPASASARPDRPARMRGRSSRGSPDAVLLDVCGERGVARREEVPALRIARDRDVVQVRHLVRVRGGLDRGEAGVADRRRRQTPELARVVRARGSADRAR